MYVMAYPVVPFVFYVLGVTCPPSLGPLIWSGLSLGGNLFQTTMNTAPDILDVACARNTRNVPVCLALRDVMVHAITHKN